MITGEIAVDDVGEQYGNFKVTRKVPINELQCVMRELVHGPSGARVLHLENDDPENLFCLSFKTLPETSNGVAHILEHTVLCGSDKFPVKDPFFSMNRRSLNTFMNALTGSDFTCYPAATQVSKDFYNLLDVYLDAVFHPKIDRLSFLQEGHRLEFAEPSDPSSPLEYKGIVYNEMKGAMSSSTSRLHEAINSALYPDITYGINSGGDPKDIPSLTYEQLKDFHREYYHPSRCLFFFYGDMPLAGHLDFLEANALTGVEAMEPIPPLPRQKRFDKPVSVSAPYPFAPDEDDTDATIVAISWLTCHILEQDDLLALAVLDTALMCTDASPLRGAIMDSGLCTQVGGYLDEDVSEVPLVLTMRGCRADAGKKLEAVVLATLQRLVEEGIPADHIESAIHQLELNRSEITGDSQPFGLSLFMRSALLQQHGGAPENGLVIHSLFTRLRERLAKNPMLFEQLISQYLLNNTHRALVTLSPDKDLDLKEGEAERERLDARNSELSDEEKAAIVRGAKELSDFQEEEDDDSSLPKVTLADVPKGAREYPLTIGRESGVETYNHPCFTNNLTYIDWYWSLARLSADELPAARFLSLAIPQLGCGGKDYRETLEYLQSHTGGVAMSMVLRQNANNPADYLPSMCISGKALHRKADKLFTIVGEMLTSSDLSDKARLKEIVLRQHTALQSSLNSRALRYAMRESGSGLSIPHQLQHLSSGLPYFHWIRDLAADFDSRADALIAQLKDLQQRMLCGANPEAVIASNADQYAEYVASGLHGLAGLAQHELATWQDPVAAVPIQPQGRCISAPVAFTGWSLPAPHYVDPAAPLLSIAANLFDKTVLHPCIREQGGAYGGGSGNSAISGSFSFYAYRDPNISSTFDAFHEAIDHVAAGKFTEADLEEAKLEVVQGLDQPVSPGNRAASAYGWVKEGRTLETRQQFRDRLLGGTRQSVIDAVEEHLKGRMDQGSPVVFASRELLEKENAVLKEKGYRELKISSV